MGSLDIWALEMWALDIWALEMWLLDIWALEIWAFDNTPGHSYIAAQFKLMAKYGGSAILHGLNSLDFANTI